ncbi:hypothetical protein AMATHDRAFT_61462 [Amanita thiersii Skay4041]|uniref:Pantoate--beta-alanine ligase n=1 Tax=Amanita thiersii Skay4041 TaxID=703135 RepID=A0A2A9NRC7_9AGAR|nr:hypothetical protein AMATHDRAFT_61462 [Amanita thiersii Skay4041]
MSTAASLPPSKIPLITSVAAFREWRNEVFKAGRSVGLVPTMGALHEGHLSLVRRSLAENDLTVLSIFVNPAQFAPHEDLATYPRTLPRDIELLTAESVNVPGLDQPRVASAIFLPGVKDMYPSGINQDVNAQKGTFVEVKGYSHQMEGKSRPTFFRGVATVVTKLFNVVQPTNAYFGQKDIQQAFLLRRLCLDLLLGHPDPLHLHIVPTTREQDGLALSSRNAYLSPTERRYAPVLYEALRMAEAAWKTGEKKIECVRLAVGHIQKCTERAKTDPEQVVEMRLDYVEMNDVESFDELGDEMSLSVSRPVGSASAEVVGDGSDKQVILSGAIWVGKTRLIDNIVL